MRVLDSAYDLRQTRRSWSGATSRRRSPASEAAVAKVHARGKLTARERSTLLLDEGSFREVSTAPASRHRFGLEHKKPYTDGVVTGWGTVEAARYSSTPMTSDLRRRPRRGARRENPQNHGHGHSRRVRR